MKLFGNCYCGATDCPSCGRRDEDEMDDEERQVRMEEMWERADRMRDERRERYE